jgi:hypothetical protein
MNRNLAIFLNFGRISGYWRSLKQKHLILELLIFFVSLSGYYKKICFAFWLLYSQQKKCWPGYWRCKFLGAKKTRFAMNECQSMLHPPAGQIIRHH